MLADGVVTIEEARFLQSWMESNRAAAREWPASVLYPRIQEMLEDGVLDADEQAELIDVLMDTTGGGLPAEAGIASMATSLPFDSPPPLVTFSDRRFCLTGKFVYGTREQCQSEIESRGGNSSSNLTQGTHYLVIGAIGSTDWIHSTHGRKIEKAVDLRERGFPVSIISEEYWASQL